MTHPSKTPEAQADKKEDPSSTENRRRRAMADDARYKPEGSAPRGATAALIELDKELMKLLVRRATLVSRIRGGKAHASTPGAIQSEKAVRISFETNAASFSKDPKFTRQLFSLLQELTVISKDEAQSKPGFVLSPPHKPVAVSLRGPASSRSAQLWTALAACSGTKTTFSAIPKSAGINATVQAFSQVGANVAWEQAKGPTATLIVHPGAAPSFSGKTLFAGDDPLTLYLACFLAAKDTGVTRLTGGASLKAADLAGLRHTLPLLGARLAHTIPRSQGLPATLECSGALPDAIAVPEDLPLEGVCALLLAPLVWNRPLHVDLSALPAAVATGALAELSTLFSECGSEVDSRGASLVYSPGKPLVPEAPSLPVDPVLSAYLLALPAFTGGTVSLAGTWPEHLPEAHEAQQLLAWAGLALNITGEHITSALKDSGGSLPMTLLPEDPSPAVLPLVAALFARKLRRGENPGEFPLVMEHLPLAQSFFEQLHLRLDGQDLHPVSQEDAHAVPTWSCPDAYWGMALALGAFVRPGLRLLNPDTVNERMPSFWPAYNGLPQPKEPGRSHVNKEKEHAAPARRRIIAG